ncbi:MAG: LURP-one-related/scramblase family protein [Dehalococcoidia bacterium]
MFRRGQERREERQEERQAFGARGNATQYKMRQKLASIGDDFFIENERGQRAFKVDGKALRARETLIFEDMGGNEICKIQERMLRVRDTMEIEGPNGQTLATVKKAMITPVRERWTVNVAGGQDLDVQGNLLDHEYTVEGGGQKVAEVSKRWFRVADTYGVEIAQGQNDGLILAVTVAVDMMAHEGR